MMKAHNKNRKHPTCSRCRFHGKKDIRVLQHQCPFRNCTCSSCFLIKRRSIIYRAQKNLDKSEDTSNGTESPELGSVDSSIICNAFNDISGKSGKSGANCSISRSSDSSSDATNYGTTGILSDGTAISSGAQTWKSLEQMSHHINSGIAAVPKSVQSDHYKISDFQSLCLTFPELTATQLQSIFEQCGHDFQKTIDRVLMTKWSLNDTECKPNNNEWSATTPLPQLMSSMCADYASNTTPLNSGGSTATDPMATHFYNTNSNNGQNCYDWRSNSSIGAVNDDASNLSNSDYGLDYYYDQSSMPIQGNNGEAISANWNYDYTGYWYNNQQGSNGSIGSNGNNSSYDTSTGSHTADHMAWTNGHTGPLALGQPMHEYNI